MMTTETGFMFTGTSVCAVGAFAVAFRAMSGRSRNEQSPQLPFDVIAGLPEGLVKDFADNVL